MPGGPAVIPVGVGPDDMFQLVGGTSGLHHHHTCCLGVGGRGEGGRGEGGR